jgi:hypothetical protein
MVLYRCVTLRRRTPQIIEKWFASGEMFSAFPEIMLTVCRVSSLQPVVFLAEKIFEPRRSHFSSVHYTDFQEDMPWISR